MHTMMVVCGLLWDRMGCQYNKLIIFAYNHKIINRQVVTSCNLIVYSISRALPILLHFGHRRSSLLFLGVPHWGWPSISTGSCLPALYSGVTGGFLSGWPAGTVQQKRPIDMMDTYPPRFRVLPVSRSFLAVCDDWQWNTMDIMWSGCRFWNEKIFNLVKVQRGSFIITRIPE